VIAGSAAADVAEGRPEKIAEGGYRAKAMTLPQLAQK